MRKRIKLKNNIDLQFSVKTEKVHGFVGQRYYITLFKQNKAYWGLNTTDRNYSIFLFKYAKKNAFVLYEEMEN